VRDLFDKLESIPADALPVVSAPHAIRWVERQHAADAVPPASNDPAIELLGWLELPLDDTPALIITGMNEGIVPESINADQFLPNTLRRHLGLVDNDHRHARDVFALQRMLASRERVHLVSARRSAEGDPLAPSRLLLACEPAVLTQRLRAFYGEDSEAPVVITRGRFQASVLQSEFPIPRPKGLDAPFDALRVTQFRDYLACPYRFYLKHGLQLDALDDTAVELDAARFGTLAHAVLEAFGRHDARHETDVRALRALLDALLDEAAARSFGGDAGPAVLVQIEQLRVRLREFAAWQADWTQQGWRILEVESKLIDAALDVDGHAMPIQGRVDRIDIHPVSGEWIVFDYKTSDTPKSPESAHRKKGEWVDLQLPLYRHLAHSLACAPRARQTGASGPPHVAYLQLPKTGSGVRAVQPKWTDEDFASAIACAQNVVRNVRASIFWPPRYPPPPFSEVYARITRDGQLGAEAAIQAAEAARAEETV
jgi:RecB family exonuclease